jgi:threonyl-tRNA synthetase
VGGILPFSALHNITKKTVKLTRSVSPSNRPTVVGAEEQKSRTLNIRNRDDPATQKHGALVPLDEVLSKLKDLRDERRLVNSLDP